MGQSLWKTSDQGMATANAIYRMRFSFIIKMQGILAVDLVCIILTESGCLKKNCAQGND